MVCELEQAISGWTEALGGEYVSIAEDVTRPLETATFATSQRVLARLQPATTVEVQACVRIAAQFAVSVYPISSGLNWGYGSSVPVQGNCAIIDLSRMRGISSYDAELGCVVIEPGVTQQMLHDFLKQNGDRFWMDVTGSSPDCSVIGNTIERGFGHTPYADHFANCCGFEVVLADGDCIHTGFSRFENANSGSIYRWGVGPYLDGLFSQSNFGIVTSMTVWLMPKPEYSQSFFFSCENDEDLEPLLDALAPLRLRREIDCAVHIGNAYRVMGTAQQYPWDDVGEQTPLPADAMNKARAARKFGAWSGSGSLYGSRAQVATGRKALKRALRNKVSQLRFIDDKQLDLIERFQKPARWLEPFGLMDLSAILKVLKPVYGMMRGVPSDAMLACAYWRKRTPIPAQMDLDRDKCGLLWCAPISPLGSRFARQVSDITNEVLLAHRFEPAITVTMLTERCLENVISITYDREIPGEDERAAACYTELLERLTDAGFYPYRLGIHSMACLGNAEEASVRFQRRLKQALDPNNILAPGRYEP